MPGPGFTSKLWPNVSHELYIWFNFRGQPAWLVEQEKLRRRIASVNVTVLNPPRPGKKCLVLDIGACR